MAIVPDQAGAFVRAFVRFGGARTLPATLLVVAGSLLEGFGLALLVPVLAVLVRAPGQPQGTAGRWLGEAIGALPPGRLLPIVLALFCIVLAIRAWVLLQRDRRIDRLAYGFADAQRNRVIAALAEAPWAELTALRHAQVTQVLSGEVANVAVAAHTLPQIVVAAVMLAGQLAVLAIVSPSLAVVATGLAVLGMIGLAGLSRAAARTGASGARAGFRIADQVAALLGGLKFAAAHGLREALADRVVAEGAALTERRLHERRRHSRASVAASSVAALAGIALVGVGTAIGVSAVALLAALAIVLRMSGPMRTLQSSVPQFAALMPAFAAVGALCARLERPGDPAATDAATDDAVDGAGPIEGRGLRFAHPGDPRPIIEHIDIAIAPGQVVGLAGPSGAGKTTLLDLLAGLRLPDAGTLCVDGVALTAAQLPQWRRTLAYVTQDTYLFDASLRRNLAWGARGDGGDVTDGAIRAALVATGLDALVEALPDGLDTRVGERGLRFSGGQRQRFALARAILRRPRLLLLDEATGALDLAAEDAVLAGVRQALPAAGIVLVSHRLEALAICDRRVTLAGGRIVAEAQA